MKATQLPAVKWFVDKWRRQRQPSEKSWLLVGEAAVIVLLGANLAMIMHAPQMTVALIFQVPVLAAIVNMEHRRRAPRLPQYLAPHNTAMDSPEDHLLGALDNPDYLNTLEREGQQQLCAASVLPVNAVSDGWKVLEKWGFRRDCVVPDDPLFVYVLFPGGWHLAPGDDLRWSYLVNPEGIRCAAVFYKAAPYDRRSFLRILERDLVSHKPSNT